MILLMDTREQSPLTFDHPLVEGVKKTTLKVGDYGVLLRNGEQLPVVFERKSVIDLYGTMSQGYDRFKREMERAEGLGVRLIIIVEGTLTKVLRGTKYSARPSASLVYQLFTIWAKYGVQTVFCKDREEMSEYITRFYLSHKKDHEERNKKCRK